MSAKSFDYTSMGFITFDCLGWPFTAIPEGGGCYLIDELTLAVSGAAGVAAIAAAWRDQRDGIEATGVELTERLGRRVRLDDGATAIDEALLDAAE